MSVLIEPVPKLNAVANRFVELAVFANIFVPVAFPNVPIPKLKFVANKLVLDAVVAKKLVEVAFVEVELVKTAVDAVFAPIGVLSIVPPEIVRLSATRESARVPIQVGVKVWVSPLEVMIRPMFVSEDVAKV